MLGSFREDGVDVAAATLGLRTVLDGVHGAAVQAGEALRAAQLGPAGRAFDDRDGVGRAEVGALAAADAGGQREELRGGARLLVLFGELGQHDA